MRHILLAVLLMLGAAVANAAPEPSVRFFETLPRSCSAVVLEPGYALTAAHCVADAPAGMLDERYPAIVIYKDDLDLAVIKGNFECPCAVLPPRKVEVGMGVSIVGYPFGRQMQTDAEALSPIRFWTDGLVMFVGKKIYTTAHAAPGYSGGGFFVQQMGRSVLVGISAFAIVENSMSAGSGGPSYLSFESALDAIYWDKEGSL